MLIEEEIKCLEVEEFSEDKKKFYLKDFNLDFIEWSIGISRKEVKRHDNCEVVYLLTHESRDIWKINCDNYDSLFIITLKNRDNQIFAFVNKLKIKDILDILS